MNHLFKRRIKSEDGFMGTTHAMSVVAVTLALAAFLPNFFYGKLLGTHNIAVFIAGFIIAIGAGLFPDLDNTSSSMIKVLGPLGRVLSTMMRGVSRFVYTVTHTAKEPSEADPHRQFWHTAFAAIVSSLVLSFLLSIPWILVNFGSTIVTLPKLIVFILLTVATNLVCTVFFKKIFKQKTFLGSFIVWIIGALVAVTVMSMISDGQSYTWVGFMVGLGWLTHITGDTLTTSGTPYLFPFKKHGKRWWDYRLPPHIKANSNAEWHIFFPLFIVIAIISLFALIARGG